MVNYWDFLVPPARSAALMLAASVWGPEDLPWSWSMKPGAVLKGLLSSPSAFLPRRCNLASLDSKTPFKLIRDWTRRGCVYFMYPC